MGDFTKHLLNRIRAATTDRKGRKDLPAWIESETYINGRPFSFAGHEYQKQILLDESPELVIRKSAQTGISEMAMRMALGLVMIMPGAFRVGYTFPSATFATSYSKSRFAPIITGSPSLRAAVSSDDLDSAEVKTFGVGKEIYFKGAAVGNAAISTTLDMLIHDELSFSDQTVIGDYSSRVIHSIYKWRMALSTPTFPGDPIDEAFKASRRNWNFCRCEHCGHTFIPDFYVNVQIPGWDQHLDDITAENLHKVRYREAQFLCSKCWKPTSLLPAHREWVCENPSEPHIAAGYQVQPFDAPTVVSLTDLIVGSTKYATKSKFRQFALGRPAEDTDNGLVEADIDRVGLQMAQSPFTTHVMGIDVGQTSYFMVGGVAPDGQLIVVHYERVALKNFRERYWALKAKFRVSITVMDVQPYTDLVMALSDEDPNLFGARYVSRPGLEVFSLRQREEGDSDALGPVRELSVSRNALFDRVMADIRPAEHAAPGIMIRKLEDWELVKKHLTDMKRASAALRNGEFTSIWQKSSKGQDHYHHTLGYLWIAAQMRGIAAGLASTALHGVHTFKLKSKQQR